MIEDIRKLESGTLLVCTKGDCKIFSQYTDFPHVITIKENKPFLFLRHKEYTSPFRKDTNEIQIEILYNNQTHWLVVKEYSVKTDNLPNDLKDGLYSVLWLKVISHAS